MKELPTEVLNLIFIQLPLLQKQECMFVCRRWKDIIRTICLFNTVFIQTSEAFIKFLDFIERESAFGLQVENLELFECIDFSFNRARLLFLFPNLQKVKITRAKKTPDAKEVSNEEIHLLVASEKNRIQELEDYGELELARLLITQSLCFNLNTLRLNCYPVMDSRLLLSMKDMPVLKNLTLCSIRLTIDSCEIMHTNIPTLESFVLIDVDLLLSELPEYITPNTIVRKLDIDPLEYHHHSDNWLKYLTKKYINLEHFKFDFLILFLTSEWNKDCRDEVALLFQNAAPRLKNLYFDCLTDPTLQILKVVNDFGAHLKELELQSIGDVPGLDILYEISQFKHIQKLVLQYVLPEYKLTKLREMKCLKSLTLCFVPPEDTFDGSFNTPSAFAKHQEKNTNDIVELFNTFPQSLVSIHLQYAYLKFDELKAKQEQSTFRRIKEFIIQDVDLKGVEIDKFISDCVPNLTSLTLDGIIKPNKIFMIPNHHLSSLVVNLNFYLNRKTPRHVSIVTQDCQRPRFYTKNTQQPKSYSSMSDYLLPVSLEDAKNETILTITCASVDNFAFLDGNLFLASNLEDFKSLV